MDKILETRGRILFWEYLHHLGRLQKLCNLRVQLKCSTQNCQNCLHQLYQNNMQQFHVIQSVSNIFSDDNKTAKSCCAP